MAGIAQWILLRIAKVFTAVYAGDCSTAEPDATIHSAYDAINAVNAATGIPLAPEQPSTPTGEFHLLGAAIAMPEDYIEVPLTARKAMCLAHDSRQIAQRSTLRPAQAAKMRGRLGWAQSLLLGRFGHAHLAPFAARQYAIKFPEKHTCRASYSK